ncbi:MAG: hypothetical protein KDC98_01170 [Planctomycetes bacterium]|nr:hypothetical protein [Planctomycetota bacterium]
MTKVMAIHAVVFVLAFSLSPLWEMVEQAFRADYEAIDLTLSWMPVIYPMLLVVGVACWITAAASAWLMHGGRRVHGRSVVRSSLIGLICGAAPMFLDRPWQLLLGAALAAPLLFAGQPNQSQQQTPAFGRRS